MIFIGLVADCMCHWVCLECAGRSTSEPVYMAGIWVGVGVSDCSGRTGHWFSNYLVEPQSFLGIGFEPLGKRR